MVIERWSEAIKLKLILAYIRNEGHYLRAQVAKKKGRTVINSKVRKNIKKYCRQRFGSKAYWPYLSFYTEIRGEFIEGWIPYDYFRFVLLPKLNPKPALYMNDLKTYDYRLFGDFAVKPLFLYICDMFFDTELKVVDRTKVEHFMSGYDKKVVIKEEGGWGGQQVRIFHASKFMYEKLNPHKNYVIQPKVDQYKLLNDLYPHSVNTLRVNTFMRRDGSTEVKYVWLRFGRDGKYVDSGTMGGYYVFLDMSGKPSAYCFDPSLGIEVTDKHPNTGFKFSDIKIPMYQNILEKCKNAHKLFPYNRLIAWDVCINSLGEPKLLEWNTNNPGFASPEASYGPFWIDDDEI